MVYLPRKWKEKESFWPVCEPKSVIYIHFSSIWFVKNIYEMVTQAFYREMI